MKDIPVDSPFYSFHEWREKTQNHTQLNLRSDVWLGLYLARKFDVRFVVRPGFVYDGKSVIVKTIQFSDLPELERFFEKHEVALYEIFQQPIVWTFHTISADLHTVTPLDSPILNLGHFVVRGYVIKERDGNEEV